VGSVIIIFKISDQEVVAICIMDCDKKKFRSKSVFTLSDFLFDFEFDLYTL
jgi:hypothetical protein